MHLKTLFLYPKTNEMFSMNSTSGTHSNSDISFDMLKERQRKDFAVSKVEKRLSKCTNLTNYF